MSDPTAPNLVIVRSVRELREAVAGWRRVGETVGLVPTMGALHTAHMALVDEARKHADRVVATIFVNPTQFGPDEDFSSYPRREARDIETLRTHGVDLLFAPGVEDMYPAGFETNVNVPDISQGLCGDHRPGHFAGVATIVTKLLLQALPDCAVFGEKDYQQLQVIRRLALDLDIPVAIIGLPTVREADGLAVSSRNANLSPADRATAPKMHVALKGVAARLLAGETAAVACAAGHEALAAAGFSPIEYLEVRAADTLLPASQAPAGTPLRALAAAWLGETRLIDNLPVA
ncbi:MAG: pantoate--beta-alanine ligase [Rhodospirillaceae bacterium]|jgi:pantoate--beta-alanine ligase|nr:pantoate--beta-alanine ligase [Rhodospirillaceae bacterium]MBT3932085.1 pantoate--beta-alanine ligase [Rhodospirillaceae bacterium]MBT4772671.1 pantoate--beta-alanine ligase [Rhodospirillaceae bacterium]MBT5358151.1 pantoate--beta-alanine ligase [Rhodospirillaceae bacterium]MBT5769392.1 pantoate--beta-alanine ligase [Rhodospirillaceae bacterium]